MTKKTQKRTKPAKLGTKRAKAATQVAPAKKTTPAKPPGKVYVLADRPRGTAVRRPRRDGHCEFAEHAPDYATHQQHRDEHGDQGQGNGNDGEADLA
jgi:hypothetical protein